jgi:hypothetical protein
MHGFKVWLQVLLNNISKEILSFEGVKTETGKSTGVSGGAGILDQITCEHPHLAS